MATEDQGIVTAEPPRHDPLEEYARLLDQYEPDPLEQYAEALPGSSLTAERQKELDERAKRLASDPTGASGVLEWEAASEARPWEYGYIEQKFHEELKESKPASKLSMGEKVASAGLRGVAKLGEMVLGPVIGQLAPETQLDDEQELFRQRLGAIREGGDPLVDRDAPWYKRGIVGAAEQYPTMVTSVAAGSIAGSGAAALKLGSLGVRLASGAGVGAVYYKQMRDDTYFSLLRAGVAPEVAGPAAAISGILQGLAEGLPISNPFSPGVLNKTIRGVVVNQIKRFGVETGGEEFAQAIIDGTVQELTKRSAGKGGNLGPAASARKIFVDSVKQTWEGMPTATFLMGPGMVLGGAAESAAILQQSKRRVEMLKQIKGKGWVAHG